MERSAQWGRSFGGGEKIPVVPGARTHGYNYLETRASRCALHGAMGGMSMFGPHSGSGERPLLIELRSPSENGDSESSYGKLWDELLDREIFYTLREAQVLIEWWRQQDNTVRRHSALGYRPRRPRHGRSPRSPAAAPAAGVRSRLDLTLRVVNRSGQARGERGCSASQRPPTLA